MPEGFGPPTTLVDAIIVAIILLTALFVAFAALPDDEWRITRRVRGRTINLLFLIFPTLILVSMGGGTDLLLAGDAGYLPPALRMPGFAIAIGLAALGVAGTLTLLL